MKLVTVYTTDRCSSCMIAKTLLQRRGIGYQEINLSRDPDSREKLVRLTGRLTFPQILIDDEPLGGLEELVVADREGRLSELEAA